MQTNLIECPEITECFVNITYHKNSGTCYPRYAGIEVWPKRYFSESSKVRTKKPNWVHLLYKKDPTKYTQRGKLRHPTSGRFLVGTNQPYRKGAVPSKIQDILIGCLLGDASGELATKAKTPCFAFKQGMIHADYLYFLYFIFTNWGYTSSNAPIPFATKDGKGNTHLALRFRTLAVPSLAYIYNMFYPNNKTKTPVKPQLAVNTYATKSRVQHNKKIVPYNIGDLLNARALAFWIMDDGSWTGSGVLLHCNNFVLSDVKLLANVLKENFHLRVTVRIKGENHILYIHAESIKLLISLVKQYMRPEFFYKLGIKIPNVYSKDLHSK